MTFILWFFSLWFCLTCAIRLMHRESDQIVLNAETLTAVPVEEFVLLPIEHNNRTSPKFANRFFVKADWYEPGGPVFLYDGGEGAASTEYIQKSKRTPFESLSFFEKFLKNHKGLGIVWEHRYYGKSLPFPEEQLNQSKEEDYKYLTTQQALLDVVAFADSFKRPKPFQSVNFSPKSTPWIFIGCSYPGSRAALMRVAYPDTIFASYAASAPIEAKTEMSSYWEPIWSGIRKYGYPNCTADMHAALVAIDTRLGRSAADAFAIKRKLFNCTKPALSHANFAQSLSYLWSTWQSYGMDFQPETDSQPYRPGIKDMCDFISYNPDTKGYSSAGGWAKVHLKGVDFTLGRLQNWPGLINQTSFDNDTIVTCPTTPPRALIQCGNDSAVDEISWKYQYCTEWGYWQVGNPGDSQIVSKYYDLDFFRQQCLCQFQPSANGRRAIPDTPRVDLINKMYGGRNMRPSRTFFTVGEFDPWSTLSPLKVDNFTVPDCDASTAAGAPLFGKVLRNKQHCGDFDNKDKDARHAHELFSTALKEWLCCYVKKNKTNLNKGAEDVLCPPKKQSVGQKERMVDS